MDYGHTPATLYFERVSLSCSPAWASCPSVARFPESGGGAGRPSRASSMPLSRPEVRRRRARPDAGLEIGPAAIGNRMPRRNRRLCDQARLKVSGSRLQIHRAIAVRLRLPSWMSAPGRSGAAGLNTRVPARSSRVAGPAGAKTQEAPREHRLELFRQGVGKASGGDFLQTFRRGDRVHLQIRYVYFPRTEDPASCPFSARFAARRRPEISRCSNAFKFSATASTSTRARQSREQRSVYAEGHKRGCQAGFGKVASPFA